MTTPRLIETWLPIAALGEESVRERRSMTALPPTYYLHVWWARRPLVASRAAVLASLLPADADRTTFLHTIGIHGDPAAVKKRIDAAKKTGEDLGTDPYGYRRAFTYAPSLSEQAWIREQAKRLGIGEPAVLDPTAGGGSIPFEALRLGYSVFANDLNPVAALILRATTEFPARFGAEVGRRFNELAAEFLRRAENRLAAFFPREQPGTIVDGYLWARTIRCPYCTGLIPLSPNWRLSSDGTGVRVRPDIKSRSCSFEIVDKSSDESPGTVKEGDGICPFPDCGRVVDSAEVKQQAQAGGMGEQLYAVAFRKRVTKKTKSGKERETWERGYRAARAEDDVSSVVLGEFEAGLVEWEALGTVPSERFPAICNDDRPIQYGMPLWRDFFSARQLIGHQMGVALLRELVEERQAAKTLDDVSRAAVVYLAFGLDKLLNYNCRACRWDTTTGRIRSKFDRHDFAFVWSYAEMAPSVTGSGFAWAFEQTAKCIGELTELVNPDLMKSRTTSPTSAQAGLFVSTGKQQQITISNESADALSGIAPGSIDAIVMDPPYYDNVMYAELSDFFYVWLKRTAGLVYPELFRRQLTDKDNEAVANPAKFAGQLRPRDLADRDYQHRMSAIFSECRRALKPDGVLTVMFTHKATGAWDALATGLLEAGLSITASWPINTESESSLHIKNKAAANSTIFLVCRPRPERPVADSRYWEDVEPLVGEAVRKRIESFEKAGIRGVDLYLSCFGPALEEFAKHWPLTRGQPRASVEPQKGRRKAEGDALDPYAVTPEDALDAARREVKKWKLDRLMRTNRHADLDPMMEWFALAWDAFEAPQFPYDEALRLARVVGVDLDREIVGRLAEKKGGDVVLWDSGRRAAKGALGPADGSRSMIDALHHAAHRGRSVGLDAAHEQLSKTKADQHSSFTAALTVLLEVLPVSSRFTNVVEDAGPIADAASDFDVLEQLRRLAYSDKVREPEQIKIWTEAPEARA
jgi:adenine-specific DNA methylase